MQLSYKGAISEQYILLSYYQTKFSLLLKVTINLNVSKEISAWPGLPQDQQLPLLPTLHIHLTTILEHFGSFYLCSIRL